MTPEERLNIEERIITMLKTVYDPEIPVDIYVYVDGYFGVIYGFEHRYDALLNI